MASRGPYSSLHLARVVREKEPLNRCVCVCACMCVSIMSQLIEGTLFAICQYQFLSRNVAENFNSAFYSYKFIVKTALSRGLHLSIIYHLFE